MDWIDRHSVNCFVCNDLVDERDCIPGKGGEGDICPKCQKEHPEAMMTEEEAEDERR